MIIASKTHGVPQFTQRLRVITLLNIFLFNFRLPSKNSSSSSSPTLNVTFPDARVSMLFSSLSSLSLALSLSPVLFCRDVMAMMVARG